MSIVLNTGFSIGSKDLVYDKFVLTKEEMLNIHENTYPDQFFALCSDDDKMYSFNINNTPNAETGKFKVMSGGSGSGVLEAKLTFTKDVGYVSAGTVYGAGTKIEDILREMVYKQPTDGLLTYYGYFDCSTTHIAVTNPTVDDVKALNSEVIGTKEFTFNIDDMAYGQIAYAYPASFGKLSKITVNGMINYLNSCTKVDMIIDGINYVLYFLTEPCGGLVDIPIECA